MVDDEDIPISYLFYTVAVLVLLGVFFIAGFVLWAR